MHENYGITVTWVLDSQLGGYRCAAARRRVTYVLCSPLHQKRRFWTVSV